MIPFVALDLFSGAGGTTQGLRDAGYAVFAAIENDLKAAETYAANHPDTLLLRRDIRRVQAPALSRRIDAAGLTLDLLTACPPCQSFSTLGSGEAADPRNALVSSVGRFISNLRPHVVLLENVPGIRRERRFARLIAEMEGDYVVAQYMVQAADFGVPQNRRRLIALGVDRALGIEPPRDLRSALPPGFDASRHTAGDVLKEVSALNSETDPVHRARRLRPKTLERIRVVTPGGGRVQLPAHLQLDCHGKLERRDATSIYGRIDPAGPAPTMTTRCTTPSCGRFVHPVEDRGITLREAALLQTFPLDYRFCGGHDQIERQIGNAVPPRLAEALGVIVAALLAAGHWVAKAA
jgi:DNA (cytosine-5)-methyltransferase 1